MKRYLIVTSFVTSKLWNSYRKYPCEKLNGSKFIESSETGAFAKRELVFYHLEPCLHVKNERRGHSIAAQIGRYTAEVKGLDFKLHYGTRNSSSYGTILHNIKQSRSLFFFLCGSLRMRLVRWIIYTFADKSSSAIMLRKKIKRKVCCVRTKEAQHCSQEVSRGKQFDRFNSILHLKSAFFCVSCKQV